MCLAIPARLISCTENSAIADLHGNRVEISTVLVPEAKQGDWVLLHAGFAIQRLDEAEAKETWAMIKDVQKSGEAP